MIDEIKKAGKLFKELLVEAVEEYGPVSAIVGIFTVSLGCLMILMFAESSPDDKIKDKHLFAAGIPAIIVIFVLAAGFFFVAPESNGSPATDSCWSEYGQDYVNYTGNCIHEQEAAEKLAQMFPENYEPVKTGELKAKTGLTGFSEFPTVKRIAEENGLIYCYSRNTGFASAQEYCKQGGAAN